MSYHWRGIEPLESRLFLNAALDTDFANGGMLAGYGPVLSVQGDGKILADHDGTIARLNPDGSVDHSFDPASYHAPSTDLVQSTGKRLVVTLDSSRQLTSISRFNADGSLDTSFGDNGHVTVFLQYPTRGEQGTLHDFSSPLSDYSNTPLFAALQGDAIVIAGEAHNDQDQFVPTVQRLTSDGQIDSVFGMSAAEPGTELDDGLIVKALQVGRDQRIYINAEESDGDGDIQGYAPDGTWFTNYRAQSTGYIVGMLASPDGQLNVLTQHTDTVSPQPGDHFATFQRLNPDLTPDTTLNGSGQYIFTLDQNDPRGPRFGIDATSLAIGEDSSAVVGIASSENPDATAPPQYLLKFIPHHSDGGSSISGFIFIDANANGTRDAGEPALRYPQAYVDANNNGAFDLGERTTYGDYNGYYKFHNLPTGTYVIREVEQSGFFRTMPAGNLPGGSYSVTVGSSDDLQDIAFGNTPARISGYVTKDNGTNTASTPLSGVTVYIDANNDGQFSAGELSATTDSSGGYFFATLAANSGSPVTYALRVVAPSGLTPEIPAGALTVTLSNAQSDNAPDFILQPDPGTTPAPSTGTGGGTTDNSGGSSGGDNSGSNGTGGATNPGGTPIPMPAPVPTPVPVPALPTTIAGFKALLASDKSAIQLAARNYKTQLVTLKRALKSGQRAYAAATRQLKAAEHAMKSAQRSGNTASASLIQSSIASLSAQSQDLLTQTETDRGAVAAFKTMGSSGIIVARQKLKADTLSYKVFRSHAAKRSK